MNKDLIVIENGGLTQDVSLAIANFERQIKDLKEQEDLLKGAILEAMENNNILKLDTPDLIISYLAPSDRESFDSKKLKEDNQDLYDEYVKMTPVKSSIRIKVK